MGKIRKLPSELIDKIAAGEVVERPASVVKELVENSLDAEASFVEVEIERGGKEKIVVKDNGTGMAKEDAIKAFQRHSTSKITQLEDLTAIGTLGFRGEALSSIGSVSKVILQTKTENEIKGTQITLSGGKEHSTETCAHPVGTTITVKSIFYNIPARHKFLKSTKTEYNHIQEWLKAISLAWPEKGFRLTHNGREIFSYPENQERQERIENVLTGEEGQLIPVTRKASYVEISGFITPPRKARKRSENQFLFVNRRYLRNKTVWGAVKQAYKHILPAGMYPPFVLFLNIRKDLIDVNVHPRKEEIKFISPGMVFDLAKSAVETALSKELSKEGASFVPAEIRHRSGRKPDFETSGIEYREQRYKTKHDYLAERPSLYQVKESLDFLDQTERTLESQKGIIQIDNTYLVYKEGNNLIIVDQHAADERIFLEKFIKSYQENLEEGNSQEMLLPLEIKLQNKDIEVINENKETLERIGFLIEFPKETYLKILAIPTELTGRDIEPIFLGFVDDLKKEIDNTFEKGKELEISTETYRALATMACRAARKGGDYLQEAEKNYIVESLQELGIRGSTCPHGRPTWIKITTKELAKMFKR